MTAPYPNFPPTYTIVRKNGGYDRDCLVIELSTLGPMDSKRLAQVEDAIGVAIANFQEVERGYRGNWRGRVQNRPLNNRAFA